MTKYFLSPHQRLGNLPQTKESKLSNGVNGNYQTVDIMKDLARTRSIHPLIRRLAMNIIEDARIPSHNYLDECKAIGEYAKNHIRYIKDPQGTEQLTDPLTMVDMLKENRAMGDCDDISLFIATLLLAVGHQPYFVILRYYKTTGPFNHIYVCVYDKNLGQKEQRFVLDGIVKHKPLGYEINGKAKEEIKV